MCKTPFPLSHDALIGNWYSEVPYSCTMILLPKREDGLEMKLILDNNAATPPRGFRFEDDSLIWEINDDQNRGRCTLHVEEENGAVILTGTYTQLGHPEFPAPVFRKVSDTPTFPKRSLVLPDNFGLTVGELIGSWVSPVPWDCTMSFSPNFDNNCYEVELTLAFGYNSWDPNRFRFEDDALIWEINDDKNRGRCTLRAKWENGAVILTGTYTQLGHPEFPAPLFRKVSDTPKQPERAIPLPDKSRLELLRDNAAYGEPAPAVETQFSLWEPLPEALADYELDRYLKDKTGDEIAFACLNFICDHFHHYGSSGMPPYDHRTLGDFIDYCREHDHQTNCRGLSIMLATLLRAQGIKAQHITCMPYEEPFDDCHVVVDCRLPSGRRIMLDPTYRLYFHEENGSPVSLRRLRELLLSDGRLLPNQDAGYTGNASFEFHLDGYRDYMAKNTLRFTKGKLSADGNDEWESVNLWPAGYPYEKSARSKNAVNLFSPDAFWGE